MAKMWIDIEDMSNEYDIGYVIQENIMLIGYEYKTCKLNELIKAIEAYKVTDLYYFDGNDNNYIFINLLNELKQNEYAKNVTFHNIGSEYKKYLDGSKLKQLSKNADLARAFGIKLDFNNLHHPLYDIQLTYCSYHNFKIDNEQTRKNKIFDSFFVLTNKFDIYWKVLKKFNVPKQFVDVKIIEPNNPQKVYFVDLKVRESIDDKYLVFTNAHDLDDVFKIDIKKENVNEIIRIFNSNFTIFTDTKQQSDLSRQIWEVQYLDFNTRRLNADAFAIRKNLYIFMCVNISRFKQAMNDFSYETVMKELGVELNLENLKLINCLD